MNLQDAVYNSLLWTPGKVASKGSATAGEVMLWKNYLYSTDGHVFLRVTITDGLWDPKDSNDYFRTGEDLKKDPGGVWKEQSPAGSQSFWDGVRYLLNSDTDTTYGDVFAISPERLGKFSLLRPRGEYPIDLKHCILHDGQLAVSFRYGPDVLGIFSPLDRVHLTEVYQGQENVLWEEVNR